MAEESDHDTQHVLEIKGLQTHFKTDEGVVRAVDGVTYSLKAGECLGVVGESGSGKSVTQITVLGLIPKPPGIIAGGEIWFEGQDLLKLSDKELRKIRGNKISMIWQDPMSSLNPFLKVSRQLIEPLMTHQNMSKKEARTVAVAMLEKVGIPAAKERFDQYPHQFSGGMRQRVMIAMALLCKPKLLIADEPTTALDVTIQAQILELIKGLRQELGTSVIMITHDLGVVAGMADRILVMYAGRIMEEAPANALFHQPSHPYTVGLLRSVPRLDKGQSGKLIPIDGLPPNLAKPVSGCPFAPRCVWAQEQCHEAYPEVVEFDDGHRSTCWRAKEVRAAKLGTEASLEHIEGVEGRLKTPGHVNDRMTKEEE